MTDALLVLMRWLHLTSMATLVGGMLCGRLAVATSENTLAADARGAFGEHMAGAWRPLVLAAIGGLLISGIFNLLTNPGHTTKYHVLLGVKLLLALHVFASALLATKARNPRRARQMASAVISGLVIIAISAYLRRIV